MASLTSSSSSSATGRAKLSIQWPASTISRQVPDLSQSIVVDILRGSDRQVFDTKIVPRPADVSVPSVVTFDSLPVDTLTLRVSAHPNADGTGVAQAAGETPLVIVAGQETDFGTLTMGTTIDTITVASPNGNTTVSSDAGPQQWTATARDSKQAVVLVNPAKQLWTSSNPVVAAVDAKTGLVTPLSAGTTTIKESDTETSVSGSVDLSVVNPPVAGLLPAQFNPRDPAYAAPSAGGLSLTDGHIYQFNTDALPNPILTDTTSSATIATGRYVTQTFALARTSVTYAVFDFAQDIHIGNASQVRAVGANPVVVLTQGNALIDGKAVVDFSANGATPGAGGGGRGPGVGTSSFISTMHFKLHDYGGGGFGGAGGGGSVGGVAYGSEFSALPTPHLQGGSSGGSAGGGAFYLASIGSLTVSDATIKARGGQVASGSSAGGSGGGLALFGGGGVMFAQASLDVSGGKGIGSYSFTNPISGENVTTTYNYYGGGGGRIAVGYGAGMAPDMSQAVAAGGTGGTSGTAASAGQISSGAFGGF